MARTVLLSFVLLLAASSAVPQNSIPVQFAQAPGRNTMIGTLTRSNVLYGSLNELARAFRLPFAPNVEASKVELASEFFRLRVSANNPYVVIEDMKENASLVQMPVGVLMVGDAYYVPLEAFLPILSTLTREEISFDRSRILVGRPIPLSSYDVTGLLFEEKSNGFLVRIRCQRKLSDYESWLKPIGNDTWLYITLPGVRADVQAIRATALSGMARQVLVFQSPTSVQLTLKLKGPVQSTEVIPAENSTDILVAIHVPTEEELAAAKRGREYGEALQRERDKWKLDVIVIDAGHGGEDPGTLGLRRTKEKEITLAIALKIGKLIEKSLKGVKVVYTRKGDQFVELYRRGQIANQNGGKLFISVHCNSLPRGRAGTNGFEIYLLRPGKTENAIKIAERENDVVKLEQDYEKRYQQLTEENFILLTMAQSAYVKYSEQFANILQQEMEKHVDISNNGVKQAGFYVLVGASMPNILLETAYLSNKHDEKILRSPQGQQRIAEAVLNAVKRYKLEYEKSLREGVEFGAATVR